MNAFGSNYRLKYFLRLQPYEQAAILKSSFVWASCTYIHNSLIDHHPGRQLLISPQNRLAFGVGDQLVHLFQKLANFDHLTSTQWGRNQ